MRLRDQIADNTKPVILYEVIPPSCDVDDLCKEAYVKCAGELVTSTTIPVSAFNIPEIRSEERGDERTYEYLAKIDPRIFGQELKEFVLGEVDVIINHSPVYDDVDFQLKWLEETRKQYGVENLIIIGGESRKIKYPGPSVTKMMELIQKQYSELFCCGGISIPTRRDLAEGFDEPERMLVKQNSGIEFFTTQILYESKTISQLLEDYQRSCEDKNCTPKRVLLSFAPVTSGKDVQFLKWLGVKMPATVEHRLMRADIGIGWRSLKVTRELLEEVFEFMQKHKITVPIGLNIEHITQRNFEISRELIENLGQCYSDYLGDGKKVRA